MLPGGAQHSEPIDPARCFLLGNKASTSHIRPLGNLCSRVHCSEELGQCGRNKGNSFFQRVLLVTYQPFPINFPTEGSGQVTGCCFASFSRFSLYHRHRLPPETEGGFDC